MNDLFDQQITESLHRNANHASLPRPSFGDVRRRVRVRRQRNVVAMAVPAVLGVAAIGLRANGGSGSSVAGAASDSVVDTSEAATSTSVAESTTTWGVGNVITSDLPPSTATPTTSPADSSTAPTPLGVDANLFADVARRVELAQPALAGLGFASNEYTTDAQGVTTLTASDPNRPNERRLIMTMRPGVAEVTPTTATSTDRNGKVSFKFQANDGWIYTVEVDDLNGTELPTSAQLQALQVALNQ